MVGETRQFLPPILDPQKLSCVQGAAVSVGEGGVLIVMVEADLTATHFSFFPSSTTTEESSSDFSVSSSEVTLSSVSASTPVVVSDSEPEADDDDDEEVASEEVVVTSSVDVDVVAGVDDTAAAAAAAGVDSVDEVLVAIEESLFAASFLALARSFLSSF